MGLLAFQSAFRASFLGSFNMFFLGLEATSVR